MGNILYLGPEWANCTSIVIFMGVEFGVCLLCVTAAWFMGAR